MWHQLEQELQMLDRHLEIFQEVIEQHPIGIVNLSNNTGHPNHKVRYSLRILEENGLIEPTENGAVPTEQAVTFVDSLEGQLDAVREQLDGMKLETS